MWTIGLGGGGEAVLGRGFRSPKVLVDAHRFPVIDYTAGPRAAAAGDGDDRHQRRTDRRRGSYSGGVERCDRSDSSTLEVAEPLQAAAAAYNVDPKIWMLTGGDDHALVACLPEGVELPDGFLEIGQVREGAAQVTVDGSEPEWLEGPGGFTHFA